MNKQDKMNFIDEKISVGESKPCRNKFEQLSTAIELHYLADNHNWDSGVEILQWIIESDLCSEATALMIFWRAQPEDYTAYKWDAKRNDNDFETFQLLKTIMINFENGFYKKSEIHYDPMLDCAQAEQHVPEFMSLPTSGEEPYVFYDEKEVNSWLGEYLASKIKNCDTVLELFNIAVFVKDVDRAKLILQHPLCDKGIAVMLFWRLKVIGKVWCETNSILTEIINKVRKNEYPEVLCYDPVKDIVIKKIKPKWQIPERMMRLI